jgi:hypothetical protein
MGYFAFFIESVVDRESLAEDIVLTVVFEMVCGLVCGLVWTALAVALLSERSMCCDHFFHVSREVSLRIEDRVS